MRQNAGLRKRTIKHGRIWCAPLRLYFPRIFRITRKAVKRAREDNAPAPQRTAYTLDPTAMTAIRGYAFDEIDHLDRNASHSLILRHHWSRSLASSYLEGVEDAMDACNSTGLFEVDDAVFTLTERPTRADWPASMIIYVAEIYAAQNAIDAEHFEVVVGPDGRAVPRELLG